MRDSRYKSALVILFLYGLLTIILTWPLVTHLQTHVLGPEKADNYEYVWKLWWVPHALFEEHISPFVQPNIYYPFGYLLGYGEITPLHTFLLMPLTLLIGEVTAYNLIMLVSTTLSGWFTYFLARRWLRPLVGEPGNEQLLTISSFLVGCSFAFSEYQMVRFTGHLPLIATQWIVLAIYALDRWLSDGRRRDAVLLGIAVALATLASWYYAFVLALALPIYAALRAENLRAVLMRRQTWVHMALALVIIVVLCGPFLIPYLQVAREGSSRVPLDSASFWSASPIDYLVPNPQNPLWGRLAQIIVWPFGGPAPGEFMSVSIGWITLLFGIIGWRRVHGKVWRALKWIAVIAFVLSLGPVLNFSRIPTGIPLPDMLLRMLPIADSLRSWGRFSVLVILVFSLLAGAGLILWVQRRSARVQPLLAGAICAALIFTLWNGPAPLVPVEPRPVDVWLAQQPGNFAIMQYPIQTALSGPSMLYTRYHHKRIVFGYGTYLPLYYRERHPALVTFPADEALAQLRAWGVKYILVALNDLRNEPYTLDDIDRQSHLRHVITLGDQAVYEILP